MSARLGALFVTLAVVQSGCGSRSELPLPSAGEPRCTLLGSFQRGVTNPPGYGSVELLGVALAPNRDIGLLASFSGTLDLGSKVIQSAPSSYLDLVVARLSPEGELRWVRHVVGGSGVPLRGGMGFDSNDDAYIVLESEDPIDLGLGTLPAHGFSDLVIAKFSSDGTPLQNRRFGAPLNFVEVRDTAFDSNGDLIVVGSTDAASGYVGSVDFGGGARVGVNDDFDGFYAAYDASLNHRYSFRMASPALDTMDSVAMEASGGALVGGFSEGSSSLPDLQLPNASTGYLLLVLPNGTLDVGTVAPPAGPQGAVAQTRFVSLAVDRTTAMSYAVGTWGASVDFSGHPLDPAPRHAFFDGFAAGGQRLFEHYAPDDFGPSAELDRVAVDAQSNVLVVGSSKQGMSFFAPPFDHRPGPVFGVFDAGGSPVCALSLDTALHVDSVNILGDDADGSVLVAGALGPPNPIALLFVRIRP